MRPSAIKYLLVFLASLIVLATNGQPYSLPLMHINTKDSLRITSKKDYIPATYFIVDALHPELNVGSEESPEELEIRGRGHSSWRSAKKPYKIKLTKKTPLLGMNSHRHWALLKFYEPTVAGMQLGKMMEMDWTPSTHPVEVILNGDSLGMYLLTETNRISKNRIDIYEQPDMNEDEATIPYGWLVEVDNYRELNQISVSETAGRNILITYHSPEVLSAAQKTWLVDEFTNISTSIYEEDKTNSSWEQLIDVEAMAKYFIVQEVLDNSDGFHGSFYLYKDLEEDALWMAGPLWDLSCGQRKKTDYTFRMKASYAFTPHWIGELIKDEDFCSAVRNAWDDFYPQEVESWMEYIDEHLLPYSEAFEKEKRLWTYSSNETLEQRVSKLKSALAANIEWFNDHLPKGTVNEVYSLDMADKKIVKVEYINLAGMRSSQPWKGMNVKETTYDDNSIVTSKLFINH